MTITSRQDLDTRRGRIFFWIGLVILPLFWIGWMTPRHFSKTQRGLAWGWLAIYTTGLVFYHEALLGFMPPWAVSYPGVAMRLNLALFVWLVIRSVGFSWFISLAVVSIDIVAILASLMVPTWNMIERTMPGLKPLIFAPAVLLAVMHLLLDPVRGWYQKRQASRLQWD